MLTVLMYHSVGVPDEGTYDVSIEAFTEQMDMIAGLAAQPMGVSEAIDSCSDNGILVTFDDGHRSVLENALPIMAERNIKSTVYITTAYPDSGDCWLSWTQLEELASCGVELEAHGHTHRFLNGLSQADLVDELDRPRQLIRDRLGHQVKHLAVPGGRYNKEVLSTAGELGYQSIATSRPGLWQGAGDQDVPHMIDRYCVTRNTSHAIFQRMIEQDRAYAAQTRAAYSGKQLARRLLGDRLYQAVWAMKNKGKKK